MPYTLYSTVKHLGIPRAIIDATVVDALRTVRSPRAIVSVHCIGDTRMSRLNWQYRRVRGTTDVLSFPTQEDGVWTGGADERGDIFISIPQIKRQARAHQISFREEFVRMLAHGVLHVFGYDHAKTSEAKVMYGIQEKIVSRIV